MAKEYRLSKVLPPLVRLSELVSTSDHFRVLGGFDLEIAGFLSMILSSWWISEGSQFPRLHAERDKETKMRGVRLLQFHGEQLL
ncbi:hypothetical protein AAC387_Pa02g4520 [Persea americana]